MLTAISGTYENGQVTLDELPPVQTKAKVVVTFLQEEHPPTPMPKDRVSGSLKGKISLPDDFNEPLDDLKEYMF